MPGLHTVRSEDSKPMRGAHVLATLHAMNGKAAARLQG